MTSEPLRIDVVVIKKASDIIIEKNIGAIFKKINIIEYKSPDDYLSIKDFNLVYAYACIYMALYGTDIKELTLTFVENRRPKAILEYFQKVRGYTVVEKQSGIYNIEGDILSMQIINSQRLPLEENIWLRGLSNKLETLDIQRITEEMDKQEKAVRAKAYLNVISKANPKNIEEVLKMSKTALTLEKVFEDAGLTAKWEARGEVRGVEKKALIVAKNMLKSGFSLEQTANLSELDVEKVKELANKESMK